MKLFRFVIVEAHPEDPPVLGVDLQCVCHGALEAQQAFAAVRGNPLSERTYLMTWSLDRGIRMTDFSSKRSGGYESYNQVPSEIRDRVEAEVLDWLKEMLGTDPLELF